MKNILLMCSAGMSTSIMVKKMTEAAAKINADVSIKAIPEQALSDHLANTDIILLGPQVRFLQDKVKAAAKDIPVRVIDTMDYGMMDGEKILLQTLKILGEN
ncbi:PTS sugar transporter subunit IIB [Pantoea sp. Bo_2]|uniref:PTS sugar transporter subunit IIB n=1 Tax=Candidatus Pantoea gossypiicola TaxID=2608008 RepID=A0AB34CKV0_9GAMM|nr:MULTISPECIES: PTS sugar transporter subunit IIB [Pantoea]KAA5931048.1 PTS sugar transporter subunit IIB [Pantoea sp. VH_8]KAA5935715.1 PTS sugar transporter subunit IIB [Pantoea sp. VH_4]KAA5948832.1 PTS sugar transporter subunit IIB [Pantoea sp. VH_3]KAA5950651.1 PTS sugar transporter subunit IIB [Pantoea sp. VH_24]KAA5955215.1 PTS sugar transporter subunit IIB [Pantoea sp. VH_25]